MWGGCGQRSRLWGWRIQWQSEGEEREICFWESTACVMGHYFVPLLKKSLYLEVPLLRSPFTKKFNSQINDIPFQVRTVDVYDPTSDSWSSIASMEARRRSLKPKLCVSVFVLDTLKCLLGLSHNLDLHFEQHSWGGSAE